MIKPVTMYQALGELGRPARVAGGKGGSARDFTQTNDIVALGSKANTGAGLYLASPFFKMMGTVELLSPESGIAEEKPAFGDHPILF